MFKTTNVHYYRTPKKFPILKFNDTDAKNQYFSPFQAEASAEAEADAQRSERDAQGYGYGGYGKYCQEVAQETAYNVPVPAPVDIPVKVSFIFYNKRHV